MKKIFLVWAAILFLFINACSSSDDSTVNSYTIGCTVSGLVGSGLELQNNGVDDLSISADGDFTFATKINNDAAYNVTVGTQPTGQTCVVSNASGAVDGSNVTNVSVECHNSGSLDTTFGTGGIVTTAVGASYDYAYSVALQSDGKIVAAGYSNNGSNGGFALVRYWP